MFLVIPEYFVLLSGEFLKTVLKVSSVSSVQSFLDIDNTSGLGLKSGSLCGFENRFQGQTSWQTSQPKAQSLNLPFIS